MSDNTVHNLYPTNFLTVEGGKTLNLQSNFYRQKIHNCTEFRKA